VAFGRATGRVKPLRAKAVRGNWAMAPWVTLVGVGPFLISGNLDYSSTGT